MDDRLIDIDKSNGVYYTPYELADALVAPLLIDPKSTIFDPAYGEGSLLLAAERILSKIPGSTNPENHLYGCDLHPVNGLLAHLLEANLTALDYFDYPTSKKFDVILMNPPYVRHHLIEKDKKPKYRERVAQLLELKSTSDLWAYFLVKSVGHLIEGGNIGAILPWSFLQADYAQPIRAWLCSQFKEIKVQALGAKYFDKAKERVVLVWLRDYGSRCSSIQITSSRKASNGLKYTGLAQREWESDRVVLSEDVNSNEILSKYVHDFSFSQFSDYAKVRIGVVTGADSYFIIAPSELDAGLEFSGCLIPIYTTSRDIKGLRSNGQSPSRNLLVLSEANYKKFKGYIQSGEKMGYHLRAHSRRRNPWYAVNIGQTPDAFFPYRMSKIPYLTTNDRHVQCTNSIHRVYFNSLSDTEIKWIQLSMLSVASQLSIECQSKTYGRGMLKIEPKSLKNSIVYKANSKNINAVFRAVNRLLLKGDKVGAMDLSTEFIDENLGIPEDLSNAAKSCLIGLQSRRQDR